METSNSYVLSYEIDKLLGVIAIESNFEKYKILTKEQEFTGENYLGDIIRVTISNGDQSKVINLIIKKCIDSEETRNTFPVATFYKREYSAYSEILPELYKLQEINNIAYQERFKFAKFYKAIMEDRKEMIVMSDLSYQGFGMYDRQKPFDYDHAELVVKNIARIHATSFVMKEMNPELFKKLLKMVAIQSNYPEVIEVMVDNASKKLLPLVEDIEKREKAAGACLDVQQKFDLFLDSTLTEPYNVICHGDCWSNNMLFKYENKKVSEVIFVDWQIIRYASPTTDIANMLCLTTDKKMRDKHFCQLLDIYYETLEASISKMGGDIASSYPKEIFRKHVKEFMKYGFIIAMCALPLILTESGKEKKLDESLANETHVNNNISNRMNDLIDFLVDGDYI